MQQLYLTRRNLFDLAVEDADYYTDREPGLVHPADTK
jgi:hypothetical protein